MNFALCLIFGKVSFKTYLEKEISVRFAKSHHILNEYCCRTFGMHGSLKRIDKTFFESSALHACAFAGLKMWVHRFSFSCYRPLIMSILCELDLNRRTFHWRDITFVFLGTYFNRNCFKIIPLYFARWRGWVTDHCNITKPPPLILWGSVSPIFPALIEKHIYLRR